MKLYGRKTVPIVRECSCVQQPSGHEIMAINVGNSKFVCYVWALLALQRLTKGCAINCQYESRLEMFSNVDRGTSLTEADLNKGVMGFANNLRFRKEDFQCNHCCEEGSDTPNYIVMDGKCLAPRSKQTEHLQELDQDSQDNSALRESTKFNDRCFISKKKERKHISDMITEDISVNEFLGKVFENENAVLVRNLVRRLAQRAPDISDPYKRFIGNLAKPSPIAGYLQPLDSNTLNWLIDFCDHRVDIRSADRLHVSNKLTEELPALWPLLCQLLEEEKTQWLPDDVASIVR